LTIRPPASTIWTVNKRARLRAARTRHPGLTVVYVVSDYSEKIPKPCMNDWGTRQLTVMPDGTVLPCPAAASSAVQDRQQLIYRTAAVQRRIARGAPEPGRV
jgi:MoaA/NifB/PqqE/SkfB family radical SAM enzyme